MPGSRRNRRTGYSLRHSHDHSEAGPKMWTINLRRKYSKWQCAPSCGHEKYNDQIDLLSVRMYDKLYKSYLYRSDVMTETKGKYAWTATVGEKGQIVIPKQARTLFNINPGDTLLLLGDEERGIAIPNKGAFTELFSAAFAEDKSTEGKGTEDKGADDKAREDKGGDRK